MTIDGSMIQAVVVITVMIIGFVITGRIAIHRLGALEKRMDANDEKWDQAAVDAKNDRRGLHTRIDETNKGLGELREDLREMRGQLRGSGYINGSQHHAP